MDWEDLQQMDVWSDLSLAQLSLAQGFKKHFKALEDKNKTDLEVDMFPLTPQVWTVPPFIAM